MNSSRQALWRVFEWAQSLEIFPGDPLAQLTLHFNQSQTNAAPFCWATLAGDPGAAEKLPAPVGGVKRSV